MVLSRSGILLALALTCSTVLSQTKQISAGPVLDVPIGYSSSWFTAGPGLSLGYEVPLGERITGEAMLSYSFIGVASGAKPFFNKASIYHYQVGFKYFTGRYIQAGFYARAQIGYHGFFLREDGPAALPIETGLVMGTEYHIGLGAGAGYMLEHFDFSLQQNILFDRTGIAGVKPQQFITLRVAYLFNMDS